MDIFLKATAGVLITVVISLVLSKQGKDFSTMLIISVCAMVAVGAFSYLQKILQFVEMLDSVGNLNSEFISIMLKAVGIGLLSEITVLICSDSGHSALGKVIQMLSTAVILWLCIPLFTELLELTKNLLGNV